MKTLFIIFLLTLVQFTAQTQTPAKRNAVYLSSGLGNTLYYDMNSMCAGLQYSRLLAQHFQVEMGATYTEGDGGHTVDGVVIYKQLSGWSPFAKVQLTLFPQRNKWDVFFGFGNSYHRYHVSYTQEVHTGTDLIGYIMRQETEHDIKQLAATFSLKFRYYIHPKWFVEIGATHDRLFNPKEIPALTTTIIWYYDNDFDRIITTSLPQHIRHINLGIGCSF